MKILLSLIILFVPISILAKQICLAPSGCSIEIDTGFCPKCIEVKEEPPIITKEVVVKNEFPIVNNNPSILITDGNKSSTKPKVSYTGCTWKCIVEPCDDDMLPKGCRWVGR